MMVGGLLKMSTAPAAVSRKSAVASATSPVMRPHRSVPDRDAFEDADDEAAPARRLATRLGTGWPRRVRIAVGGADQIGNPAGIIAAALGVVRNRRPVRSPCASLVMA